MQYLFMLYSDESGWNRLSVAEQQAAEAAYTAYTEALSKAGVLIGCNRLQDSDTATTVRVAEGRPIVQDGPYAEAREQIGGYYLVEAPDLDAALAWAARCPGAGHGTIEVRPVWEK